jgi:hypothetical protein
MFELHPEQAQELARAPERGGGKKSDLEMARRVVEQWGRPIAAVGQQLWSPTESGAWAPQTDALHALIVEMTQRSPRRSGVAEILCAKYAVPAADSVEHPSTYHRWVGDWEDGRWEP